MLLHQLREHLVLVEELGLELFHPFAFGLEFFARLLLECRGAVLKELLLPAVEDRGLKVVLVAKIRDGHVVEKMSLQYRNLLRWGVVLSLLVHGNSSVWSTLTLTDEFSNSR